MSLDSDHAVGRSHHRCRRLRPLGIAVVSTATLLLPLTPMPAAASPSVTATAPAAPGTASLRVVDLSTASLTLQPRLA